MSEKIVLVFKPNGEMTLQGEPGSNAEQKLKAILGDIGNIERRGHKHSAAQEETIKVSNK